MVIGLCEFPRSCCSKRGRGLARTDDGTRAEMRSPAPIASSQTLRRRSRGDRRSTCAGARSIALLTLSLSLHPWRILRLRFGRDPGRRRGDVAEPGEYSRAAPRGVREARQSTVRRRRLPPRLTPAARRDQSERDAPFASPSLRRATPEQPVRASGVWPQARRAARRADRQSAPPPRAKSKHQPRRSSSVSICAALRGARQSALRGAQRRQGADARKTDRRRLAGRCLL